MGGNARVGLEDALNIVKGQLATSNAEQVKKAVPIEEAIGLEVASFVGACHQGYHHE